MERVTDVEASNSERLSQCHVQDVCRFRCCTEAVVPRAVTGVTSVTGVFLARATPAYNGNKLTTYYSYSDKGAICLPILCVIFFLLEDGANF